MAPTGRPRSAAAGARVGTRELRRSDPTGRSAPSRRASTRTSSQSHSIPPAARRMVASRAHSTRPSATSPARDSACLKVPAAIAGSSATTSQPAACVTSPTRRGLVTRLRLAAPTGRTMDPAMAAPAPRTATRRCSAMPGSNCSRRSASSGRSGHAIAPGMRTGPPIRHS